MRWAVIAVVLWAGCDKKARHATSPSPTGRPSADAEVVVKRAGILLESHLPESKTATYVGVDSATLVIGSERTLPALPLENWEGHFATVAAADGDWFAHGDGHHVIVENGTRLVADVDLGAVEPVALQVIYPRGLFVGAKEKLLWVDLGASAPKVVELANRPGAFKAYDLFARAGDRVLAVDDVVMPLFADLWKVGGGTPQRLGDFTMPGLINGMYRYAALVPVEGGFDVFVIAPYGIMDGWGHVLARMPIRGDKLDVDRDMPLNSQNKGPFHISEHVSRQTQKPEKLAAGADFTEWTGLAVRGDEVLVAAGARGLLRFPKQLAETAEVTSVGGSCHDVLVLGERVLVLVEREGKGALLELGADGAQVSEHALPAVYQRFVR